MTDDRHTPDPIDAIQSMIDATVRSMRISIPAKVLSYDSTTQTATVRPSVRFRHKDPDTGESVAYRPGPIANVPVMFPSGGGFSMTWPLSTGDHVDLIVCDRSIDEWAATGSDDNTPADKRRFDITDAFAYPGGRPPADALDTDAVDSSVPVMKLDTEVRFGSSNAQEFAARADRVEDRLQAIEDYLAGHEHDYTSPLLPSGTAPTLQQRANALVDTAAPATVDGATASDKVKIE